MQMPACCKDDMAEKMKGGMAKGKAMVAALAAHKAGKHDDDGDDDEGDGGSEES